MQRIASSHLRLDVRGDADLVFAVAAETPGEETFTVTHDGEPLSLDEIVDEAGSRFHAVSVGPGAVIADYRVTVSGRSEPIRVMPADRIEYLRPSRYCESDTLTPIARAEFAGIDGPDLLHAVSSWVGARLSYVPGSSLPTDGAVETLLRRSGVCRDYAHLVVALLRALDVPARVVSVYAPGLQPMDFHAVAEALVDDEWRAVDATTLAPRSSLIRIATGRDASDTAFLSSYGAPVILSSLIVTATADELPGDDLDRVVTIG